MPVQPVPHNHHYVPQFLLRNFVDCNEKVWVYDTERQKISHKSPRKAASALDFYAWTKADGSTDYQTIEDYFDKVFENGAAVAIQRLLRRELLETHEIASFFRFVAAQLCRTPAFFTRIRDSMAPVMQEMFDRMVKFDASFRERVATSLASTGTTPEEIDGLFATLANGGAEVIPDRQFVMQQSLKLIEAIAEDFKCMDWCFSDVLPGEPDLVIADHPVTLHDADPASDGRGPVGIRSPHVEITLPLSSRMLASARWNGASSYGNLKRGAVEEANYRMLLSAHRYVIASFRSDDLLADAMDAKAHAPRSHVHRIKEGKSLTIVTAFH